MRFELKWFNPFRNPISLLIQVRKQMKWQREYEELHPDYKRESDKFVSAGIGLLVQIYGIMFLIWVGAKLI